MSSKDSKDGARDDALAAGTVGGTDSAANLQQPRVPDAVADDGVPNDRRDGDDGGEAEAAVGGGNGEGSPFVSAARQNNEAAVAHANFDTPGGVDSSRPSGGMPTNFYDPQGDESVRMLDARIRELQARRSEIARRCVR